MAVPGFAFWPHGASSKKLSVCSLYGVVPTLAGTPRRSIWFVRHLSHGSSRKLVLCVRCVVWCPPWPGHLVGPCLRPFEVGGKGGWERDVEEKQGRSVEREGGHGKGKEGENGTEIVRKIEKRKMKGKELG